jgi:OmpA-OmpF porin, OOP family
MKTQPLDENFAKRTSPIAKPSDWRGYMARLAIVTVPLILLASGCSQTASTPPPAPQVAAAQPTQQKVDLRGIEFQHDGKIDPSSKPVLDAAAQLLKTQTDAKVYINAYCDPSGGPQLNQRLSDERAAAVKAYLIKDGIERDRLIAQGHGATDFVASNATANGRKQNRRIELLIVRS